MAYQVVGILICKGVELYMTSITIKMNDCLSLPLLFYPYINRLQPDLQSTNCSLIVLKHMFTSRLTQSVAILIYKCMHAGTCAHTTTHPYSNVMSLDVFKFSVNTFLLVDKPEENNSLSSHFQEFYFKSYLMTFAMSLTTSWLVCCKIFHKEIVLRTHTASSANFQRKLLCWLGQFS